MFLRPLFVIKRHFFSVCIFCSHVPHTTIMDRPTPDRRRVRSRKRRGFNFGWLSDDIWRIVLHWLKSSPYKALMLGWTSWHMHTLVIRSSPEFWFDILRCDQEAYFNDQHERGSISCISLRVPGIALRPVPNFKSKHERYATPWRSYTAEKRWPNVMISDHGVRVLASYCRRVIMLKNACRCSLCGARWRHVPVWSLRMRVCFDCFRGNFVSNVVLYHSYGVNFWEHMTAIVGRIFYFSTAFMPKTVARQYSWDPLDFATGKKDHPFVFFWRPHLEMYLDLSRREEEHRLRRAAAAVIVQRVRVLLLHANVRANGAALFRVLRMGRDRVDLFRERLCVFMPITATPSPNTVLARLKVIEALRVGRVLQSQCTYSPGPGVRKVFDQWDDRLVESIM